MKKLHRLLILISAVASLGFGSGCETLKKEYSLENRGSSFVDKRKLSEQGKQTFEKLKEKKQYHALSPIHCGIAAGRQHFDKKFKHAAY